MKHAVVTPQRFQVHQGTIELLSKVTLLDNDNKIRQRDHYSAQDVTVEQLCREVAERFRLSEGNVDFQRPLFALPMREYHAGDYLI